MDHDIQLKRIYAAAEAGDGTRVLVDRLWPRGKRRDALSLSEWCRDVAPSSGLRRAWHRGEIDADRFAAEYRKELQQGTDYVLRLMRYARQGPVTLLTATRKPEQSHLPILRQVIIEELEREDREADGREASSPVCYDGE